MSFVKRAKGGWLGLARSGQGVGPAGEAQLQFVAPEPLF